MFRFVTVALSAMALAAGFSVSVPGPARAQAAGDEAMEAASGLYLRAGVGSERSRDTRFLDKDCSLEADGNSEGLTALYGCGTGWDGLQHGSSGDFGNMPGFELGAGYTVSPLLRIEASIQQRSSITFEGRSNYLDGERMEDARAEVSALSAMLVAYVDLSELGASRIGVFRPFVGAGFGHSRIKISDMQIQFPVTTTRVPDGEKTNFAWMLTAGASAPMTERVTIDLALRYTDLGSVETGRGGGLVAFPDTEQYRDRADIPLNLPETAADLTSIGFWVSLRYAF